MRLASYNVENLFDRAKVMNFDTWAEGAKTLDRFSKLNALLGRTKYSGTDKAKMVKLFKQLGLEKSDQGKFVILRQNKGKLLKRSKTGGLSIEASGRAEWVGSLDLLGEPIDEVAMQNTARVFRVLDADVLGVIEAESRPVLVEFNAKIVKDKVASRLTHVMLVDGNDERGIDVAIMTRDGFEIDSVRSHVDDLMNDRKTFVFSRDCPEYTITTRNGNRLVVLVNHFKSKGFGSPAGNDARRLAQAERVRQIYDDLVKAGEKFIAVIGDFNDTPGSAPLKPLLEGTDLKDVFVGPNFDDGGFPGTFGLCNENQKFDYILLSPKLMGRMRKGGIFRKGMFPGVKPVRWDVFPTLVNKIDAASDHAAVWVDLDV